MTRSTIPLSVPDLRGNEGKYLARCVADSWVSSAGPLVGEFETRVAATTGRRHAVATVNGTAAIHLALVVLGAGPGTFVIVPDWTFAATANAVLHAGATPIFVDVTSETWTLDPEIVDTVLRTFERGPIAAVIAVDALGHPADMEALDKVCRAADVALVEDAAGAIGSDYKGRPAGSFGKLSVFSFNGNKLVTAGGGGMALTDDSDMADRMRHLSVQARLENSYEHDAVGFNYRMTNINAAVGIAQIERLVEMVASKAEIADRYDEALADLSGIRQMPRASWATSNNWLYSVDAGSPDTAATLVAHMQAGGIDARVFWRALSDQAPYARFPKYLTGIAAALSGSVVSLPSSSHLLRSEQDRVIASLRAWSAAAERTAMAGRERDVNSPAVIS